jgi:hypothetical protein
LKELFFLKSLFTFILCFLLFAQSPIPAPEMAEGASLSALRDKGGRRTSFLKKRSKKL